MQYETKFLHAESRDYDFTDEKGVHRAGTSHKAWVWAGPGNAPVELKLTDEAASRLKRNMPTPLDDVTVTHEVRSSSRGMRVGKAIDIAATE